MKCKRCNKDYPIKNLFICPCHPFFKEEPTWNDIFKIYPVTYQDKSIWMAIQDKRKRHPLDKVNILTEQYSNKEKNERHFTRFFK